MPSAPLVLPVTFVILCLYESMSNCVMSCLKTWWTYQMPGDSMQGLARCQPRLGVGRRRLSKPEHSHSFQLKVRSVFAHKSSKSSKYSSAIWSYMIYFYNLKGSGGRYFSCHHVIAWASFPISGEFEDTSKRGLMLVHLDSAVQHIEALQLSKLLKSQDLEFWSSQTLKTSFKVLLNSLDCSKEFLISLINWWSIGFNWGFSCQYIAVDVEAPSIGQGRAGWRNRILRWIQGDPRDELMNCNFRWVWACIYWSRTFQSFQFADVV